MANVRLFPSDPKLPPPIPNTAETWDCTGCLLAALFDPCTNDNEEWPICDEFLIPDGDPGEGSGLALSAVLPASVLLLELMQLMLFRTCGEEDVSFLEHANYVSGDFMTMIVLLASPIISVPNSWLIIVDSELSE